MAVTVLRKSNQMWFQDSFSKKTFGWLGGRWHGYKSREWRRNRGEARSQHPYLNASHAFPPSKPSNLDHCNFCFQTQEAEGFWRKSPKLASNSTSAQLDSVATNVCLVGFWSASFPAPFDSAPPPPLLPWADVKTQQQQPPFPKNSHLKGRGIHPPSLGLIFYLHSEFTPSFFFKTLQK